MATTAIATGTIKAAQIHKPEVSVQVVGRAIPVPGQGQMRSSVTREERSLLACARGDEGGLKILAKAVEKTKNDYNHHAWGQGAYFMEQWGAAALRVNRLDVAEEAFLEALAHDSGSARGALGMQVVCERQGRSEEAVRFAELAQRCWRRADAGVVAAELGRLRGEAHAATGTAAQGGAKGSAH